MNYFWLSGNAITKLVAGLIVLVMVLAGVIGIFAFNQVFSPNSPTPTPTTESMILSHTNYTDYGYFYVVGEVKNKISSNIHYVMITATFYDSGSTEMGTAYGFSDMDILTPNQKSSFDLCSFPNKIVPANYKLTVSYVTTAKQPFQGLAIISNTPSIESSGYHHIVGEVKNNGATQATYVEVDCTYYDSAGKVLGSSFTFTEPIDLNGGDAAPFELSSFPRIITPASYELQVQGRGESNPFRQVQKISEDKYLLKV